MTGRGNFYKTTREEEILVEDGPSTPAAHVSKEADSSVGTADTTADSPAVPAVPAVSSVATRRRGATTLGTAEAEDITEAVAVEEDTEETAAPEATATDAPESDPDRLNLATVIADPTTGLPPIVKPPTPAASGSMDGSPPASNPADSGPASTPDPRSEEERRATEQDELHAELMQFLARPMQAFVSKADARSSELAIERQGLAAERSALEAALTEKQKAELASAGRRGGGNGSFFGGVGTAIGSLGAGLGARLGGKRATQMLDGIEGRRLKEVAGRMDSLDKEIGSHQGLRNGLLAKNYARTLDAAAQFRRSQVALTNAVEQFNAKFEASPKGAAFLRQLESVAHSRGLSVDEMRSNIHDLSNGEPVIERLRDTATKLCADPEFAGDVQQMERIVDRMRRNGSAMARGLRTAEENGMDLGTLEGLEDVVAKMDLPDAKLARPGSEVPLDSLKEEQKRWTEQMSELIKAILDKVKAVFGLGGRGA